MSEDRQPILKRLLILLALINLAALGARLWPWPVILYQLDDMSAAVDPAITMAAYIGISFWIGGTRTPEMRKALFSAGVIGIAAGLVLAGEILLGTQTPTDDSSRPTQILYALMGVAIVLWGIAGFRAKRAGQTVGGAALCSMWSAAFSCQIACSALLAGSYLSMSPGQTADPWKQYQGLAIGAEAVQGLVKSLLTASGYLLLGPIVAAVAGLIFGSFGKPAKD